MGTKLTARLRAVDWWTMLDRAMVTFGLTGLALALAPMAAHAGPATGFGAYVGNTWTNFDFSSTIPYMAGGLGTVGGGISAWKLYQGITDGGRLSDHVPAVGGMAGSAILLGFAGYKAALAATGAG